MGPMSHRRIVDECAVERELAEESEELAETLRHYHSLIHRSHVTRLTRRIELGPRRQRIGEKRYLYYLNA
jgi:hypothetical protein